MCEVEKSIRISLVRERLAIVGSRNGEDEENENHFGKHASPSRTERARADLVR